ncbi:MAG: glycosyltransferase family 2 protein [Candidatus Bathyarchaeia archaeon]
MITVAVVARDEENFIGRCLRSILRNRPDEVIVVAHKCVDRTIRVAAKFGIKTAQCERSYGEAFNVALGAAGSKYVFFVDADSVLPDNFLRKLKKTTLPILSRDDKVAGVGCFLHPYNDDCLLKHLEWLIYDYSQRKKCSKHIGSLAGGTVWNRDLLLKVGGFRPLDGGPEPELCNRLTESGYSLVLLPSLTLYHEFVHKMDWRVLFGGFHVPQNVENIYFLLRLFSAPISAAMLTVDTWKKDRSISSFMLLAYYPFKRFVAAFSSFAGYFWGLVVG